VVSGAQSTKEESKKKTQREGKKHRRNKRRETVNAGVDQRLVGTKQRDLEGGGTRVEQLVAGTKVTREQQEN